MDPSEEKISRCQPARKKSSFVFPVMVLFALLLAGSGIAFYINYQADTPLAIPEQLEEDKDVQTQPVSAEGSEEVESVIAETIETIAASDVTAIPQNSKPIPESVAIPEQEITVSPPEAITVPTVPSEAITAPAIPPEPPPFAVCSEPEKRLDAFYTHLDRQPYMMAYGLKETSQDHFTALIEKLLDHPPKVTRESDDLYTILRNTAHFFRIAGKDNILMLQGILNSENKKLEQILADYYFLISTPECGRTKYAENISNNDLYEYGCFFLNTMGGRLYLFRRDSLSRMVVTYYAILLVDDANNQQNNRHGINLKPAVTMLLSEMETGGSSLKYFENYIDMLYDLKEKYQ